MNLTINNQSNVDEVSILNNSETIIVTEHKRSQTILLAAATGIVLDFCGLTDPTYIKIVADKAINITMGGNTITNSTYFECLGDITEIIIGNASAAEDVNVSFILSK